MTEENNPLTEHHITLIAQELNIASFKINNTLNLLQQGATIPFISRYRKEATGSLDEVQISKINILAKKYIELEHRRQFILDTIEEQDKLTSQLKNQILKTYNATQLEDLYLPYKKKRKTRATAAKEKGLEPLAHALMLQKNNNVKNLASQYINEQVQDTTEALQGAKDIIAEIINEDQHARQILRKKFEQQAYISSKVIKTKTEQAAKFQDYFEFSEKLSKSPSHRILAMFRGQEEGFLRLDISPDHEDAIYHLENFFIKKNNESSRVIIDALQDAYKRLLLPSIQTEFRQHAKDKADQEAIDVFASNLKQLLLAPPLGQKTVLGLDPGFRTGIKTIVLNNTGALLHHTTIFPHPPKNDTIQSAITIKKLVDKYHIQAIAIGNGTAGRETEEFCKSIGLPNSLQVFMVNEAGASIYSASEIAREEFPNHDLTVRGAVSIGRRLMDPLAELVKIDPKSIGVGQYQHDVNQKKLKESLNQIVENCVNSVGINVNTASAELLTHVSGLGPTLAKNIVSHRSENGPFDQRSQVKKVPRLGDKAYEQCVGFLRVKDSKNPLDNTGVHPESYYIVKKMAEDTNVKVEELIANHELLKK